MKNNYRPGLVGALITLFTAREDRSNAVTLLNEAVSWHLSHKVNMQQIALLFAIFNQH